VAPLDDKLVAFLEGGVSIVAASRRAGILPVVARAAGCRVSADRQSVAILVSCTQGAELLDALRGGAPIAVVFGVPSSHRTIQLKGAAATLEPLAPGDQELLRRYADAFVADVCPLGYREALVRAIVAGEPEDFVAVFFTPGAAFDQTPGPRAGSPLGA
jgi:hypothetical protein